MNCLELAQTQPPVLFRWLASRRRDGSGSLLVSLCTAAAVRAQDFLVAGDPRPLDHRGPSPDRSPDTAL